MEPAQACLACMCFVFLLQLLACMAPFVNWSLPLCINHVSTHLQQYLHNMSELHNQFTDYIEASFNYTVQDNCGPNIGDWQQRGMLQQRQRCLLPRTCPELQARCTVP